MIPFIKRIQCKKCPYYLGYIKFNMNPCINCKVNGGSNPPPKLPMQNNTKGKRRR